jgi:hypothetical protein
LPGVVRERHCNRNERRQLLRSSASTVFILPFNVRVARMGAHAPIITEVLRLQEVTRRRGRQPRTPSHGQCKCYFCQLMLVPTGNFGNVLAGYYSKRMGLPVGDFIVATNDLSACRRRREAGAEAGAGGAVPPPPTASREERALCTRLRPTRPRLTRSGGASRTRDDLLHIRPHLIHVGIGVIWMNDPTWQMRHDFGRRSWLHGDGRSITRS